MSDTETKLSCGEAAFWAQELEKMISNYSLFDQYALNLWNGVKNFKFDAYKNIEAFNKENNIQKIMQTKLFSPYIHWALNGEGRGLQGTAADNATLRLNAAAKTIVENHLVQNTAGAIGVKHEKIFDFITAKAKNPRVLQWFQDQIASFNPDITICFAAENRLGGMKNLQANMRYHKKCKTDEQNLHHQYAMVLKPELLN